MMIWVIALKVGSILNDQYEMSEIIILAYLLKSIILIQIKY